MADYPTYPTNAATTMPRDRGVRVDEQDERPGLETAIGHAHARADRLEEMFQLLFSKLDPILTQEVPNSGMGAAATEQEGSFSDLTKRVHALDERLHALGYRMDLLLGRVDL